MEAHWAHHPVIFLLEEFHFAALTLKVPLFWRCKGRPVLHYVAYCALSPLLTLSPPQNNDTSLPMGDWCHVVMNSQIWGRRTHNVGRAPGVVVCRCVRVFIYVCVLLGGAAGYMLLPNEGWCWGGWSGGAGEWVYLLQHDIWGVRTPLRTCSRCLFCLCLTHNNTHTNTLTHTLPPAAPSWDKVWIISSFVMVPLD